MKTKKRQKLCYNCEGEVDLDVIVCPFCAADLREEKPEQHMSSFHEPSSFKNTDAQKSLYPPHYVPKVKFEEEPEAIHQPQIAVEEEESKSPYGSIVMLTLAVQLLLLGFFMLLFSSKGALILKWDAKSWYFYVLASVPLFIFGIKSLKKLG